MEDDGLSGVAADPLKYESAIRALRRRVPMTDDEFEKLAEEEREFAFTAAGVAELDLVADVFVAVERAVRDGTTVEQFKEDVGEKLARSWGGEDEGRLDNIFRTNVMTSYNGGWYEESTAPAVLEERPYWAFEGIEDSATTEDICLPIIKAAVVLPADHPWWQTHYPPLHYKCRSRTRSLTRQQAEREGITENPPTVRVLPGFGKAPSVSGSDWSPPSADDYPEPMQAAARDRLDE
jgi:hypothetical protein